MQIINDIPVEITRKNVRHINIRISSDGVVKLSYPYLCSEKKAIKFLKEKESWIKKALSKPHIEHDEYNNEESKTLLIDKAKPFLEKWQNITGLKVKKLRARYMTSRWGSYSQKTKTITLNTQLLAYDNECLDYVVLHELVHVKYHNHGNKFKSELTKYYPEWKQVRARLR